MAGEVPAIVSERLSSAVVTLQHLRPEANAALNRGNHVWPAENTSLCRTERSRIMLRIKR